MKIVKNGDDYEVVEIKDAKLEDGTLVRILDESNKKVYSMRLLLQEKETLLSEIAIINNEVTRINNLITEIEKIKDA